MSFSKDFLWGAASAAHQLEGAYLEDGKGLGIWNFFEHEGGHIAYNETADVSCDHYHHMKEDVALMKQIGLKSYRFSVSWPRVMPEGIGRVNEKGLQFYSDLVDELISAGIEPMITLFHWNLPLALFEKGGWKNPDIADWFGEYAEVVVKRLGDRVKYWMTINEPQMFIGFGLGMGLMAPFEKNDTQTMLNASVNVFRAHGKAVTAIRKHVGAEAKIGMAPTGSVWIPKDDSSKDLERCREMSFVIDKDSFFMGNSWWADPLFLGHYPEGSEEIFGDMLPKLSKEEWDEISQPLDFYGFNVYEGAHEHFDDETKYGRYEYMGSPHTMMGWSITPEVLYYAPKFFYERYHKPIMITENGMAGMDWESMDGKIHDYQRIDFTRRYLLELERAVNDGIDVIGYQHWSIMDNFEWCQGYKMRFGLIHVDYRTLKRTLKDSAYWYHDVIASNGANLSV